MKEGTSSKIAHELEVLGPWVPVIAVLVLFLVAGLDISFGGASDDARFGYVFLALFALTAAGALVWGRRPRAMALLCFALLIVHVGLAVAALSRPEVDLGAPFIIIAGSVLGAFGLAAAMFWRRSIA